MSTAEIAIPIPRPRPHALGPLATLARRRFQLTARTPRELFVPLLTPIRFELVRPPSLRAALHTDASYECWVVSVRVALQIPLITVYSRIRVTRSEDREDGKK